jgi:hypothetical protein
MAVLLALGCQKKPADNEQTGQGAPIKALPDGGAGLRLLPEPHTELPREINAVRPGPATRPTGTAAPRGEQPDGASKTLITDPTRLPRFEDYPVKERFSGKAAPVDLASHPDAPQFRTRLREQARTGPNFAGHFTVVDWGCGSPCQQQAIVDARNGRVFMPEDLSTSYGVWYRLDSKLLITDPVDHEIAKDFGDGWPDWLVTRYFVWEGGRLKEVGATRLVIERKP